MFLSHVDDQDIIRTVQNFKSKMSTDCNDLNMNMVKNITAHIVKPLKHITLCNVSGIFPKQMKTAKVIPIFKSDEKACLQITDLFFLPQFSKILEKLYNDRLDSFLYTVAPRYNAVVGVHDSGPRCKRGALGVLISATRELLNNSDRRPLHQVHEPCQSPVCLQHCLIRQYAVYGTY